MTDQIIVQLSRADGEARVSRGEPLSLPDLILMNRRLDAAVKDALDRKTVEDDRIPDLILICPETGEWIPEKDGPSCPHGPEDCQPVPFARAGTRNAAERTGAERVFAALSVHFAGHPDFDRVLADFDQNGLTEKKNDQP